jgi:hypothetical protein
MALIPKRKRKADWFWPLGALDYANEIRDFFPEEAELVGVITILWNRQELALRELFLDILEPRTKSYGEAIWDRQSTHQNKRDLLSLALETAGLSSRQKTVLEIVIERTKTIADRRNELIHAEYVVHARTDVLHAKVKAPRSNKPPRHQKLSVRDLEKAVAELQYLVQITEAAAVQLLSPEKRAEFEAIRQQLESLPRSPENQQSDSGPLSHLQKHGVKRGRPRKPLPK